jgi:hypothetical protein
MTPDATIARISSAASHLNEATRTVRILSHIAWPARHRERFLKNGSFEYPSFDTTQTLDIFQRHAARLVIIQLLMVGSIKPLIKLTPVRAC